MIINNLIVCVTNGSCRIHNIKRRHFQPFLVSLWVSSFYISVSVVINLCCSLKMIFLVIKFAKRHAANLSSTSSYLSKFSETSAGSDASRDSEISTGSETTQDLILIGWLWNHFGTQTTIWTERSPQAICFLLRVRLSGGYTYNNHCERLQLERRLEQLYQNLYQRILVQSGRVSNWCWWRLAFNVSKTQLFCIHCKDWIYRKLHVHYQFENFQLKSYWSPRSNIELELEEIPGPSLTVDSDSDSYF